jgi:hypothetical protein
MNRHAMTFSNSALFNKTSEQCRLVGARGGRARARNLRLLRAHMPATPPPAAPEPEFDPETAHEANLVLDERYPHLRDAFAARQTKRDLLIEMLQQPGGATIDQMVAAMGWDRQYARRSFRAAAGSTVRIARIVRADGTRAYVAR